MIKVAISIDDGRKDTYEIYKKIMKPLNLPVSINITTGYVKDELFGVDKEDIPCENKAMNVNELVELCTEKQVEIAGHGIKHNNDIDNLVDGVIDLRKLLTEKNVDTNIDGIVSPKSRLHMKEISVNRKKFDDINVAYFRTGDRAEELTFFKRAIRKINRYIHVPFIYCWAEKTQFIKNDDDFLLHAVCIQKNTTIKEIRNMIVKLSQMENYKGVILNFHSVLKRNEPYYDDLYSYDYDKYAELCSVLKELEEKEIIKNCKTIDFIR